MSKLFIAQVRGLDGPRPIVTARAKTEGEARLFLAATYPESEVLDVAEPSEWVSDADTGNKTGGVREHPGTE